MSKIPLYFFFSIFFFLFIFLFFFFLFFFFFPSPLLFFSLYERPHSSPPYPVTHSLPPLSLSLGRSSSASQPRATASSGAGSSPRASAPSLSTSLRRPAQHRGPPLGAPARRPVLLLHGFGASAMWQWPRTSAASSRPASTPSSRTSSSSAPPRPRSPTGPTPSRPGGADSGAELELSSRLAERCREIEAAQGGARGRRGGRRRRAASGRRASRGQGWKATSSSRNKPVFLASRVGRN